jgi:hypothetical protein
MEFGGKSAVFPGAFKLYDVALGIGRESPSLLKGSPTPFHITTNVLQNFSAGRTPNGCCLGILGPAR